MSTTPPGRPTPLRDIATRLGTVYAVINALISSLLTGGVLSADQGAALNAGLTALDVLASAIVGVVTATGTIVAAFHTARKGEHEVTPVNSPMDNQQRRLVPAEPEPLGL